jgi:hypothetical protein
MDISGVVTQLRQELERIERAIAALAGLGSQPAPRGRPPKVQVSQPAPPKAKQAAPAPPPHHVKRTMSPAARKRISAAMKQRWAKWGGKSAPTKPAAPAKKSTGRKPMSAAMRKKLSAMMKARWAATKKTA